MQRWMLFAAGLFLAMGLAACGQDQPATAKQEEAAPQEESSQQSGLEKLQADFEKAMDDARSDQRKLVEEYRAAKDEEAQAAVMEKLQALRSTMEQAQSEIAGKIVALLDSETDASQSFAIIDWLLKNSRDADVRKSVSERLVRDHLANEKVAELLPALQSGAPDVSTQQTLEAFVEKAGSDSIKGAALLTLANYIHQAKSIFGEMVAENPDFLKQFPDEQAAHIEKLAATTDEEIEAIYKKAAETYADVEFNGSTIGKLAGQRLKMMEVQKNLAVGKVAPDIEGPDIDGELFKLTDYRGKVVMLDFWGHW
jgi:hypothetical protein